MPVTDERIQEWNKQIKMLIVENKYRTILTKREEEFVDNTKKILKTKIKILSFRQSKWLGDLFNRYITYQGA